MPAQHQDVWYRPMSDLPITEPKWARMVEIRPTSVTMRSFEIKTTGRYFFGLGDSTAFVAGPLVGWSI